MLSNFTRLGYEDNGQWVALPCIKTTPDLGKEPDMVDNDTLCGKSKEMGMQDVDSLSYDCPYEVVLRQALMEGADGNVHTFIEARESDIDANGIITSASGGCFTFSGTAVIVDKGAGGLNEALVDTLIIAPKAIPVWSPTLPTLA